MACDSVEPLIVARQCGGYLAISPKHARFKIGVTAKSAEEAATLFSDTYREWEALLIEPAALNPPPADKEFT